MLKYIKTLFIFIVLSSSLYAQKNIDTNEVKNNHTFYGLASYYNNIACYIVDKEQIVHLDTNEVKLKASQWLVVVGRLEVMLIKKTGLVAKVENNNLHIINKELLTDKDTVLKTTTKDKLSSIAPELDQIRYYHLWTPLAILSKAVESSLVFINSYIVSGWGMTVVVFAIILKILMLPIAIMTTRFQRRVSQVQTQLAPKLAEIKSKYDGEEAHNHLMKAHKDLGVSPFYTLKPMLGSFIQIPILIAVFNALGEMAQFDNHSFLWINNLAYPDAIMQFSFTIPMFGNTLNLLPFLMTIITVYSTMVFTNKHATKQEVKKQKRNLYLMAIAFFVLFYPFPAVMVLYWALANILQFIQQKYLEI